MNFGVLKTGVKRVIQDSTYDDLVGDWLNDVVEELVEDLCPPGFLSIISVSTVADQAYLTLPSATCDRVIRVSVDGTEYVPIDLTELFMSYPDLDEVGDPVEFAVEGNLLYYQGIPETVTTVSVLCRRPVVQMVSASDTPDTIPVFLHGKLLISGAALKVFDEIEDGGEVDEIMRAKLETRFAEGVAILERWVVKRTSHKSRRDNRWNV